jgi:N-acyl-D-amino-acid deacylase
MRHIKVFAFVLFLCIASSGVNAIAQTIPVSGPDSPGMNSVDDEFISFMSRWNIPGGQVAVCKDGKLVYSKSFGYSDKEDKIPVSPTSLFRIASSSKPFTAVSIMKLVQEGRLKLSDRAFDILNDLVPLPNTKVDERLYDVTVRMLLEHTGGWTLEKGDRQVIYLRKAADAFGEPRPATARTIIRYAMGDSLEFDPGTQYCYSNFGYNILGRIIEKISGKNYEQYVKEEILSPAGIRNMQTAKTRSILRIPNEVKYYTENQTKYWSVLDEEEEQVTEAYGGDYFIEVMDSHGGWIASAEDLAKFVTSVDPLTTRPHILGKETVAMMLSEPMVKPPDGAEEYYAKGWDYEPKTDTWSHAGALAGTSSYMIRYGNGVTVTVVFNQLPMSKLPEYFTDLKFRTIPSAIKRVSDWPANDLFN